MALSADQRALLERVYATPEFQVASPMDRKALIEAGLVESNLRNLNYGDRDSTGYLQQRVSQGWKSPMNIEQATRNFLERAKTGDRSGSAGKLAQSVQRSAFPERYDQRSNDANQILSGKNGILSRGSTPSPARSAPAGGTTSAAPQVDRTALISAYLASQGNPDSLVSLAAGLLNSGPAKEAKASPKASKSSKSPPSGTVLERIAAAAQSMGLNVGENPAHGGVNPVHTKGSYHYKNRAVDVSGDPAKLAEFAHHVDTVYGGQLKELFWQGPRGVNRDNGRRVPQGFVSGHATHAHVAV